MSESKCAHVVYTPFTGVGLHGGFRGNQWFDHRVFIFKQYTLKSLLHQENKDFIHWISFRPEEKNHPLVRELSRHLKEKNYKFVFTFNGLMYHDDKFTHYTLYQKIRNFLMMMRDNWVYHEPKSPLSVLKQSWEDKNESLIYRLKESLHTLQDVVGSDYDWIYLTRIDSDDMFHRQTIDLIQHQEPEERKALIFDKGFIYNIKTKQLADWNPPTNPPFHTIIFPGGIFFDAYRHKAYYSSFKTHEDIPKVFKAEVLDDKKYMVTYHGKQVSTDWDSPLIKKVYHLGKYGSINPFRGYCYTVSGRNISTRWASRTRKVKNNMIGKEYTNKTDILRDFGL